MQVMEVTNEQAVLGFGVSCLFCEYFDVDIGSAIQYIPGTIYNLLFVHIIHMR
jgi:hypothetical protein